MCGFSIPSDDSELAAAFKGIVIRYFKNGSISITMVYP